MQVAVINTQNEIIYLADLADDIKAIEVAGAITIDGAPVNRHTYKVSRSKANLARAARMDLDLLTKHTYNGFDFYA